MIFADVTCPKCDGLGQWGEVLPCFDPTALGPDYETVMCPVCGGSGTVQEDVDQSD